MEAGTHIRYVKKFKHQSGCVVETFLENGNTFYLVDTPAGLEVIRPREITLIELEHKKAN